MSHSLHIVVKGRVQGVYFRVYTQKQATKLNVRGYVRNLENGDVELLAKGHPATLEQLLAWCHKGPVLAKVKQVIVTETVSHEEFSGFEIR